MAHAHGSAWFDLPLKELVSMAMTGQAGRRHFCSKMIMPLGVANSTPGSRTFLFALLDFEERGLEASEFLLGELADAVAGAWEGILLLVPEVLAVDVGEANGRIGRSGRFPYRGLRRR